MLRTTHRRVSLKLDRKEAGFLRALLRVSAIAVVRATRSPGPPLGISSPLARVGRVGAWRARVAIVVQICNVHAFCKSVFVEFVVHADSVRVTADGGVLCVVGPRRAKESRGSRESSRYLAPEGASCASWAIGAILVELISGKPVISAADEHPLSRALQAVIRCVGTPNWRECAVLGIRVPPFAVKRAAFRCSSVERRILSGTLAWVRADRMTVTSCGLCTSNAVIAE